MSSKKLFVIPIYIYDIEKESYMEKLGLDEDKVTSMKQTPLYTIYITSYYIDVGIDSETGTRDIVFSIDGQSYRTPYSEQIINEVIRPAMYGRAAIDEEKINFITEPN